MRLNRSISVLKEIPEAIYFMETRSGMFAAMGITKMEYFCDDSNFCFHWDNIEDLIKNHGNIYFNKKEYKTANGFRSAFKKKYKL